MIAIMWSRVKDNLWLFPLSIRIVVCVLWSLKKYVDFIILEEKDRKILINNFLHFNEKSIQYFLSKIIIVCGGYYMVSIRGQNIHFTSFSPYTDGNMESKNLTCYLYLPANGWEGKDVDLPWWNSRLSRFCKSASQVEEGWSCCSETLIFRNLMNLRRHKRAWNTKFRSNYSKAGCVNICFRDRYRCTDGSSKRHFRRIHPHF